MYLPKRASTTAPTPFESRLINRGYHALKNQGNPHAQTARMADYYTQQYNDMNQAGFTGLAEPVRADVVRNAVYDRMQKDIDAGTANGIVGDIEEPNFVQKVQYSTGLKEIPDGAQAEKNKALPPGPPLRETDYSAPELQWHKKQRPVVKPAPVKPVQRKAACVLPRIAQEKSAEVRTELFTPREVYNRVYGGKEKFDAALANAKAYRAAHPELKADWDLQDFSVLDTKVPYTTYDEADTLERFPLRDQNGNAPPPTLSKYIDKGKPMSEIMQGSSGRAHVWRPYDDKPEVYRGVALAPLRNASSHNTYSARESVLNTLGHETSHAIAKPKAVENPDNLFARYNSAKLRSRAAVEMVGPNYWFNSDEVSANLGSFKQLLSRYGVHPTTQAEWSAIVDRMGDPNTRRYDFKFKTGEATLETYQDDLLLEEMRTLKEKNPKEYQRIRDDFIKLAPGYVSTYRPDGSKHASVDSFIEGIVDGNNLPDHDVTVTKVLGQPVPEGYGKGAPAGAARQDSNPTTAITGSGVSQQQTGMPTWLKYALGGGLLAGGLLATTAMLSDDEDEEEVLKRKRRLRMLTQA